MAASVRIVRAGRARAFFGVLTAAVFSAAALAGNAFAQEVEAQVPITVNVGATVKIDPPAAGQGTGAQGDVAANSQQTFNIKLVGQGSTAASHQPQRQGRAGAWVSQSRGNVTLNLHPQQYQNAEISLHSLNGKRILSGKASAARGTSNISRAGIPAGVYLLSVKGAKGSSFTSKLTHNGDNLNINVAFAGDSPQLSKSAAENYGMWTITVSATGYFTQTRSFTPVAGVNAVQNFTLVSNSIEDGKYALTITRSPTVGGKVFVGNVESTGTTLHNAEAQVSVRAAAAWGYRFTGWTGALTDANESLTFNMRMNVTLTANFEYVGTRTLTVNTVPADGGTILGFGESAGLVTTLTTGSWVTVIARANTGYIFTGWSGASTSTNAAVSFTMSEDLTFTANFEYVGTRTLTVSKVPADGGTILVDNVESTGVTVHSVGRQVSVKAVANTGYIFTGWEGASTSTNDTVRVTMSDDLTLTANFEAIVVGTFTDTRDNKTYKWVRILSQTWMAENLNFSTHLLGNSWCYNSSPDSCAKYGRLYDWDAAKSVCGGLGDGWRLPDTADWNKLVMVAGGRDVAGSKLKSKTGWHNNGNGTDEFGFSALPGGSRNNDGDFGCNYAGSYGYWWSATEWRSPSPYAFFRSMRDYNDVNENYNDKGLGYSVRCVR